MTTTPSTKTVRLYCEAGDHEWDRPSQRGKRPKSCPVHKPQPEASTGPKLSREEHQKRMQEGRAAAKAERDVDGIERVERWRVLNREDANVWALYKQGEISRDEWLERKPVFDVNPSKADWKAARDAGLVADIPDGSDD